MLYCSTCSDKRKKFYYCHGFYRIKSYTRNWFLEHQHSMSQFFSWLLCLSTFHYLLYLLKLFCAFFLPLILTSLCNISYVLSDWNFDLILFFYCLNACDYIPAIQIICNEHLHSYNRLLNMGMIWCKKNSPFLTK